ncbi:MAG TPA: outer membrane beta-barrel protein [Steroidobacter sp.]|jgi:opacity protein-like surface antigen|nr:outer membrane beta-barrel protein [Steroidobacter sp.]
MQRYYVATFATLCIIWSAANAQQETRPPGWDFGADVIYQDSQDIDFNGGSRASLDSDVGVALTFGYRFNSRFELIFGLDWNTVDYDVNVASGTVGQLAFSGTGDVETWTPRVGANYNFIDGNVTPFVTASVGWSFIDTNIPQGPPQSACWWDPWWGYYCGTWQNTRSIDEFAYGVGAGLRWDASDTISLRFAYEKHWLDLGQANSTPDFDQLKLGIMARY